MSKDKKNVIELPDDLDELVGEEELHKKKYRHLTDEDMIRQPTTFGDSQFNMFRGRLASTPVFKRNVNDKEFVYFSIVVRKRVSLEEIRSDIWPCISYQPYNLDFSRAMKKGDTLVVTGKMTRFPPEEEGKLGNAYIAVDYLYPQLMKRKKDYDFSGGRDVALKNKREELFGQLSEEHD